jgi:HipA N-terminal domain
MTDQVEVWLDADFLERTCVGTLTHDRGTLRFIYQPEWLKNSQAFALDPDLSLGEGSYFPIAEVGNFRVFDDSAPDRWGQTLMKRREALAAKDENRKPKALYAWDFLLGVEDVSRLVQTKRVLGIMLTLTGCLTAACVPISSTYERIDVLHIAELHIHRFRRAHPRRHDGAIN